VSLIRIATPHPLPEKFLLKALEGVEEVLVVEELFPYLEEELLQLIGKKQLKIKVLGKHTCNSPLAGENTAEGVAAEIARFLGEYKEEEKADTSDIPAPPMRPPVLCAGCPHRASFYAVKQAMKGRKTLYAGDIGCYTLGNAMPLDMVDTCLCMGAGVNIAQGVTKVEPDRVSFAFVGDSTFFASAITGVVNAVYNQADMTLIVLDNSTTAMTGHQPHPGTGHTMMGEIVEKVSIEAVLRGCGVETVETVNPFELDKAIDCVKSVADKPGVKAIIFKSPCIAITKPVGCANINSDKCIQCKKCIRELGCPALVVSNGKVTIDESLCTGCGLCSGVCPVDAISCKGGSTNE
jgi:indolepyruvate ferredoxin oxidoreductase alpha subunit